MPEPNEPEEEVRKEVVYQRVTSSGSSRQNVAVIVVLLVIALAVVGYIFMHMR